MSGTWRTIAADLRATVDPTQSSSGPHFWAKVVGKALITPQTHAVVLFRVGSMLARTPLRPLAFILRAIALSHAGAEIHPDAQAGPGLVLVHSSGVVIGAGVRMGSDVRIHHGVTLGEPGRGGRMDEAWGFPTVGDHVTLGANAAIIGKHRIGTGSVVAANAVITRDVAEGTVVGGIPARVLREISLDEILGRPS